MLLWSLIFIGSSIFCFCSFSWFLSPFLWSCLSLLWISPVVLWVLSCPATWDFSAHWFPLPGSLTSSAPVSLKHQISDSLCPCLIFTITFCLVLPLLLLFSSLLSPRAGSSRHLSLPATCALHCSWNVFMPHLPTCVLSAVLLIKSITIHSTFGSALSFRPDRWTLPH